ncbi:MAG: DUF2520 domain-containing protein [Clostridium sp.]|nr:DUF2520 domain-containing protein [Clostridium sp.]
MTADENQRRPTAVMVGAGNLAWSLSQALSAAVDFRQVWAPTLGHAADLARLLGAEPLADISGMTDSADFYLVAVADNAYPEIVGRLPRTPGAVWAHTSGGIEASVLSPLSDNYGVFYPLQTFSRGKLVDCREVPIFIEGSNRRTTDFLTALARSVSDNVREADSRRRRVLHIAGVLTCNFVNHIWTTADTLLSKEGYDMSVVWPLIRETLDKAAQVGPEKAQTGPARRGDIDVMRSHMAELQADDAELYRTISKRILKHYGYEPDTL